MTDIALSRRFFDRLKAPKKMVVLEGASHMPTEHPGVEQLESAVVEFVAGLAREHVHGAAPAALKVEAQS
jgi:pimeloyl-ACP methyl ester carboxylesterase